MSHHDHDDARRPSHMDPAVDRAWRGASTDQPPSRLDAEILAAAHEAVTEDGHRTSPSTPRTAPRSRFAKWQPLLAAAAVAGLAVVVVPMMPRNHPMESTAPPASAPERAERPSPTPPSPVFESSVPAPPASKRENESARGESSAASRLMTGDVGTARRESPPAAAPSTAAPASASQVVPDDATMKSGATTDTAAPVRGSAAPIEDQRSVDKRKSVSESTKPTTGVANPAPAAPMAAPFPARQESAAAAAPRDPAAWAVEIVTLHDAGDLNAAADALREFRARYRDADTYLPRSLSAWARTVE